jgi:hypothetical protein
LTIELRAGASLWRACPQTGACGANVSGAHSSDLEAMEIVSPADFATIDD